MSRKKPDLEDNNKSKKSRKIKDKFVEERQTKIKPIIPMNDKQKKYINLINTKDMVIATGFAGTSKTFLPVRMACNWYLEGKINKIYFSRPAISNSKTIGLLKGSLEEKFSAWLIGVLPILKEYLGEGTVETALKHGNIEYVPLEYIKGLSAEDCVFIIDEAEDISEDEAKKIVTRQGKNCKLIISGDLQQSELKEKSGLRLLLDMAKYYQELDVGVVEFNDIEDIVRSQQCKNWIIAFTEEEMRKKSGK